MNDGSEVAPLVSVILPTHDRAATLARAIQSVLQQTFRDFELIVVDDGSTDMTPMLLRRYAADKRVKVLAGAWRGAAVSRNLGLAVARGSYLAFQDSDDEWLPQKLERAIMALRDTGPETGVYYCNMTRVSPGGERVAFPAPAVVPGRLIDEATVDYQVLGIGIQSAVIKRECIEAVGGFDEMLPRFIDLDLFARLALRYGFVRDAEALTDYHNGPGISKDRAALVAARRYLIKKYHERLRASPRHLAWQYFHLAEALAKNGEKLGSVGWVFRAWTVAPRQVGAMRAMRAIAGQWRLTKASVGL